MSGRVATTVAYAAPRRSVGTKPHSGCDAPVDSTYFSLSEGPATHSHKHNNMHITMHANLQKMLHMVLHGTKHHLTTARLVAWVEWKLS
jgi:hypothetical protein